MWDKDFLKSDLEGQSVEITQTENHRGKRLRKKSIEFQKSARQYQALRHMFNYSPT